MNDTREPIFNAQAIDIARDQQDRENMRQLIGLQKARIQQLEAEVVDLKAQLVTRQTVDEEVELTAEQAEVLEKQFQQGISADGPLPPLMWELHDSGLICVIGEEYVEISNKGHAALAAHKARIESEGE